MKEFSPINPDYKKVADVPAKKQKDVTILGKEGESFLYRTNTGEIAEEQQAIDDETVTARTNVQKQTDLYSDAEKEKNFYDIEMVIKAEIEIEDKIYSENLPPDEWMVTVDHILEKYSLQKYTPFFMAYIKEARERGERVASLWEDIKNRKESSVEGDSMDEQFARGKKAAILFGKLLGIDAVDESEVVAQKYKQGIGFIIPSHLMKKRVGDLFSPEKANSFIGGFYTETQGIPVVVQLSGLDEATSSVTFVHEVQHMKNSAKWESNVLYERDSPFMGLPGRSNLPKEIEKIYKRRRVDGNKYHPTLELQAKDEILAYIACDINMHYAQLSKEWLEEYVNRLTNILATGYFETHKQRLGSDPAEQGNVDQYAHTVREGVIAALGLIEKYHDAYPGKEYRVAIGILQNFPLKSWPAVLRLMKRKHTKNS